MTELPLSGPHIRQSRSMVLLPSVILVIFTAASILIVQSFQVIHPDVSFLAWTARQVMGPAVFGVDIYEVNPPLAFMIYSPAAVMVPLLGYDLAIKLWVTALGCLSVAMFWQTCDVRLRLPLAVALVFFIAYLLPGSFAQREQIAFILTVPYVAGPCHHRGRAILIGAMAGIGFAIKPFFLIPLILVFATRRKMRTEEWAIIATGAVYAASLLLFFQPYLFDVIPLASASYWAIHGDPAELRFLTGLVLLSAVSLSFAGAPQPEARGFLAATIGFTIAMVLQFKGFPYHAIAALGYLVLFLMARVMNARRLVALCAAINLVAIIFVMDGFTWQFSRPNELRMAVARLQAEIDRSKSFLSFSRSPMPSCPTLLYTRSEYLGMSCFDTFSSAARMPVAADPKLQERARQLSIGQAIRELERKPELVIVERLVSNSGWERVEFDLLGFYETDARFRELWGDYRYDKTIDGFEFYRRRS